MMKMHNLTILAPVALAVLAFAGCASNGHANRPSAIAVDSAGTVFPAPAPVEPSAAERHAADFAAGKTLDAKLEAAKSAAADPRLAIADRMAWAEKAVRLALHHPTFDRGDAFARYAALADEARAANVPLNPIFLNLGAAHRELTR